eukprot:9498735-Pyramimonas_sp.AAC.1
MLRRCIKQGFTRSYVTASTLHRWGYQCEGLRGRRSKFLSDELAKRGLEAGPDDPLFSNLWLPFPAGIVPRAWGGGLRM